MRCWGILCTASTQLRFHILNLSTYVYYPDGKLDIYIFYIFWIVRLLLLFFLLEIVSS